MRLAHAVFVTIAACSRIAGRSEPEAGAASATPSPPPRAEAPYVATLAKLIADPKSLKPAKVAKEGGDTEYEYAAVPGVPLPDVSLRVTATGWELSWTAPSEPVPAEDFAPSGGLRELQPHPAYDAVYTITKGPLEGATLRWSKRPGNLCMLRGSR